MFWSLVCVTAMFLATLPSYRMLARWSYAAFAGSLLLLVVVYWFPPVNGAQRWIRFGPVGLQPSEFAKLAFVLGLARYLMYRDSYRRLAGLLVPLALVMVPLVLVLKEPDLGTALVFLPVLFVMLFAAGARRRHLALLVLMAVAVLPLLWSQMSREQKSRITALAEQTQRRRKADATTAITCTRPSRLLALGGWTGSFVGGEVTLDRSAYYVPEPHTDSIAVVLGERFGLLGLGSDVDAVSAVGLARAGRRAGHARTVRTPGRRSASRRCWPRKCSINTGMLVGLLPITGLALPLVSYGGSSLLANCLALGLLLNIGLRPGYEVTNEPFRFADQAEAERQAGA